MTSITAATATKIKPTAANSGTESAARTKESLEVVFTANHDQATKQIEQVFAATKEQVEKAGQQALRTLDELAEFNRLNIDALVESGTILARGVEAVGKEVVSYAQSSLEQNIAVGRALLAVKAFDELFNIQSTYAKDSLDALIAQTSKLSELSMKITTEALHPLNARVNAAVERLGKPLA